MNRFFLLCFCLLGGVQSSIAKDYFLTIGGGPSPFNNQVSLESNVLFSQRVIAKVRKDNPSQQVYFADGKIDKRDLQYLDPNVKVSPAVRWMCRLYGDDGATNYRYRNHQVNPVDGPTRKAHIKQAFFELAEKLTENDRLIVYVTAHGGQPHDGEYDDYYSYDSDGNYTGEEGNEFDTTIALWSDETLNVSELDTWLNKFSSKTKIVLIMAQCHSGGFAHSIFHHGDKKRGLNPQLRVGFFSQHHDRAAAGCTPEIDESNYHEYSTYFWEAMGAVTRSGKPMKAPDFDNNGMVSFAEAHAHASIVSETIDIPITCSDAFLRRFSRIPSANDSQSEDASGGGILGSLFGAGKSKPKDAPKKEPEPLTRNETLAKVLARARPDQAAVIRQLSETLNVKSTDSVGKVRRRANKLEQAADEASQLWATAVLLIDTERQLLVGTVALEWPQLESEMFSPKMTELIGPQADAFVKFIESQPQCDSFLQAEKKADALEAKMDKAINREAKIRRLLRSLENVLLEHNLKFYASEKQLQHFKAMASLERGGLVAKQSK